MRLSQKRMMKKYGLTNIFLKYNPFDNGLSDQWYWVIDKERDCWLMESGFFHDPKVDHGISFKKPMDTLL